MQGFQTIVKIIVSTIQRFYSTLLQIKIYKLSALFHASISLIAIVQTILAQVYSFNVMSHNIMSNL